MADPKFFSKSQSFLVSDIVEKIPCRMVEPDTHKNADRVLLLDDVSPLNAADQSHLSFLDNSKYKDDFINTKAGACFITEEMLEYAPDNTICLVTPYPYKSYALAAQIFYPSHKTEAFIAKTAIIDPSAKIGKNVCIKEYAVINAGVEIGDNTVIENHTIIDQNVSIGQGCTIESNVSVSHAIIGDNVRLYPGVRIGQDGFGFAIDPSGHVKVPQLGRVLIEDHVQIGANTTIDRGAGPDTIIGQGTWIDNLVQIGHNVEIGRGCIIVAQVGISGSTHLGDFVAIGGQAGIAGHLKIQTGARIGAQSGVISNLAGGEEYLGSPAQPKSQFFRQLAALRRLIKTQKKS